MLELLKNRFVRLGVTMAVIGIAVATVGFYLRHHDAATTEEASAMLAAMPASSHACGGDGDKFYAYQLSSSMTIGNFRKFDLPWDSRDCITVHQASDFVADHIDELHEAVDDRNRLLDFQRKLVDEFHGAMLFETVRIGGVRAAVQEYCRLSRVGMTGYSYTYYPDANPATVKRVLLASERGYRASWDKDAPELSIYGSFDAFEHPYAIAESMYRDSFEGIKQQIKKHPLGGMTDFHTALERTCPQVL